MASLLGRPQMLHAHCITTAMTPHATLNLRFRWLSILRAGIDSWHGTPFGTPSLYCGTLVSVPVFPRGRGRAHLQLKFPRALLLMATFKIGTLISLIRPLELCTNARSQWPAPSPAILRNDEAPLAAGFDTAKNPFGPCVSAAVAIGSRPCWGDGLLLD